MRDIPRVGEVWELDPKDNNRLTALILSERARDDGVKLFDLLVLDDQLLPQDVGCVREWMLSEFLDLSEPVWRRLF